MTKRIHEILLGIISEIVIPQLESLSEVAYSYDFLETLFRDTWRETREKEGKIVEASLSKTPVTLLKMYLEELRDLGKISFKFKKGSELFESWREILGGRPDLIIFYRMQSINPIMH
jgi:hypothetical protein